MLRKSSYLKAGILCSIITITISVYGLGMAQAKVEDGTVLASGINVVDCDDIKQLDLPKTFHGVAILTNAEFRRLIMDQHFRYRDIDNDIVITSPVEMFFTDGSYELHGTRAISRGKYRIAGCAIEIESNRTLLGLGKTRLFFRLGTRLFVKSRAKSKPVYELLK